MKENEHRVCGAHFLMLKNKKDGPGPFICLRA